MLESYTRLLRAGYISSTNHDRLAAADSGFGTLG